MCLHRSLSELKLLTLLALILQPQFICFPADVQNILSQQKKMNGYEAVSPVLLENFLCVMGSLLLLNIFYFGALARIQEDNLCKCHAIFTVLNITTFPAFVMHVCMCMYMHTWPISQLSSRET